MLGYIVARSIFVTSAIAVVLLCGNAAKASTNEAVLEKLAALEARIAALETKNREYKREADEARAQARIATGKVSKLSNGDIATRVAESRASILFEASPDSWSGLVWGASAGGAVTRSRVVSTERITNSSPGFINGYNAVGSSGPSSGSGAQLDLFAGWNKELSKTFVVGGQFEVTAANLDFSSSGTKSYSYFDGNGPTGATATSGFKPQVNSRWMASALFRAGILVDERTLFYGLGGWTVAQFEPRNVTDNAFYQPQETFTASGWTAGAGIERKLDANWSVRGEYRYTHFGTRQTADSFVFQGSFPNTQSYQRNAQFDQSMQTGRIGIAYAFNPFR